MMSTLHHPQIHPKSVCAVDSADKVRVCLRRVVNDSVLEMIFMGLVCLFWYRAFRLWTGLSCRWSFDAFDGGLACDVKSTRWICVIHIDNQICRLPPHRPPFFAFTRRTLAPGGFTAIEFELCLDFIPCGDTFAGWAHLPPHTDPKVAAYIRQYTVFNVSTCFADKILLYSAVNQFVGRATFKNTCISSGSIAASGMFACAGFLHRSSQIKYGTK